MFAIVAAADMNIRGSPERPAPLPAATPARPAAEAAPAAPAPLLASEPPSVSPEDVAKAAEGVNAFLRSSGSHVQFAVHEATKRMMVEVIDDATQEVIRTIPSKELLDLAARIGEMVGTLLDTKG